jgi:hypothetical protein
LTAINGREFSAILVQFSLPAAIILLTHPKAEAPDGVRGANIISGEIMMSARELESIEPRDLPQEQLHILYAGLLSKLALTCEELIVRNEEYAEVLLHWLRSDLAGTLSYTDRMRERAGAEDFRRAAECTRTVCRTLKLELLRVNKCASSLQSSSPDIARGGGGEASAVPTREAKSA